ncbi:MAG: Hsp20/alpha crystallin family protein [Bdellovibrionales bacterium]|nr:Hsp20/alpha crystallin family protein [Bdellovibrionales bacterium]
MTQLIRAPWFREFDRFFNDVAAAPAAESTAVFAPRSDIEETEKEYLLTADLPGVKKEDLKVEFNRGELLIWGERRLERDERRENWRHVERFSGKFHRSFQVPETVDADAIEAKFEDGVLHVKLPKSEVARPRSIRVA